MQPIRVAGFAGCNFEMQPRLLTPEMGVYCENQNPGRGDLRPWMQPLNVAVLPVGRKTIYRFDRDSASDVDFWFSLTSVGHFVRAFLEDDPTERTYFTAETGGLKVTDGVLGLAGAPFPTGSRNVGLPAPVGAPVITQTTAGTGDDETRYYVYVYVNDWGEVSAPSPTSAPITCKPGAVLAISNISPVPSGSHGIDKVRIYRTQAATSGAADFFFLREFLAATSSTDDGRALNLSDQLESGGPAGELGLQWAQPPTDLTNLVGLWNGMMAGISGKAVVFCEPYKPYAWPPAYAIPCMDKPVALIAFGRNLVVLTTGTPILLVGRAPEAMDGPPLGLVLPCESSTGAVSFKFGGVWPSSDGLAYMADGGVPQIITDGLITKQQWHAMNPGTMVAAQYEGLYVCSYQDGGQRKGFCIDPRNPTSIYPFSQGFTAAYFDELQGELYVLQGVNVAKWDSGAVPMTVLHRSKVFRQPRASNAAVAEVVADDYPVNFKLWAGRYGSNGWSPGALKVNRTVNSRRTFKLPSGYLAEDMQIEVSGTGAIVAAVAASSVYDIKET
jgi:hypothetical protein